MILASKSLPSINWYYSFVPATVNMGMYQKKETIPVSNVPHVPNGATLAVKWRVDGPCWQVLSPQTHSQYGTWPLSEHYLGLGIRYMDILFAVSLCKLLIEYQSWAMDSETCKKSFTIVLIGNCIFWQTSWLLLTGNANLNLSWPQPYRHPA